MVGVAKALNDTARQTKVLTLKGGILQGQPMSAEQVRDLASLPPADVLRARCSGAIVAPLNAIVGSLQGAAAATSSGSSTPASSSSGQARPPRREAAAGGSALPERACDRGARRQPPARRPRQTAEATPATRPRPPSRRRIQGGVMAATRVTRSFDELGKMTVLDLVELKNKLEEEWGVTAAAPVAVAAPGAVAAAGGDGAAAGEEQSTFDVVLTGAGDKKIQVIKVVRAITNLGLKEAKDLVDGAPSPVKEGVTREEADPLEGPARGGGRHGRDQVGSPEQGAVEGPRRRGPSAFRERLARAASPSWGTRPSPFVWIFRREPHVSSRPGISACDEHSLPWRHVFDETRFESTRHRSRHGAGSVPAASPRTAATATVSRRGPGKASPRGRAPGTQLRKPTTRRRRRRRRSPSTMRPTRLRRTTLRTRSTSTGSTPPGTARRSVTR